MEIKNGIESNISPLQQENKNTEPIKAQRKMQATRCKGNDIKHTKSGKKQLHSSIVDDEDVPENDTILRMVLPGYNWFEDQLKNSMNSGVKGKDMLAGMVNANNRFPHKTKSNPETKSAESIPEHKFLLTKRVINSTLMLLPNNSLPLKKRKIKEELEEMNSGTKHQSQNQAQNAKKLCYPPIQKVIPILNHSKPQIIIDLSTPDEISPCNSLRPSAFRRNCTLKKNSNVEFLSTSSYENATNYQEQQIPTEMKTTMCPVPAKRVKYHSQCHVNSQFCELCSVVSQFQPPNLPKLQKQSIQAFPPNPTIIPQENYWPSNYYSNFGSYDHLMMPEIGRTFPEYREPRKMFDTFNGGHGYNTMDSSKYWSKVNTLSNEQQSEFRSTGDMTMNGQVFLNRFNPVG